MSNFEATGDLHMGGLAWVTDTRPAGVIRPVLSEGQWQAGDDPSATCGTLPRSPFRGSMTPLNSIRAGGNRTHHSDQVDNSIYEHHIRFFALAAHPDRLSR